jgi:hypothetical protein
VKLDSAEGAQRYEDNVQKNRKRSEASVSNEGRSTRRYPVQLPEVVTIDVLGAMLDEDLVVRLRVLDDDKNKVYDAHLDARPWEEEIAYIRREQQLRRARRDTHAEYVRKSEDEFARTEAHLPAGDFDNSAFVYAATGGRPRWN